MLTRTVGLIEALREVRRLVHPVDGIQEIPGAVCLRDSNGLQAARPHEAVTDQPLNAFLVGRRPVTAGLSGCAKLHRARLIQFHERTVYPSKADEFVDDFIVPRARLAGDTAECDQPHARRGQVIRLQPAPQLQPVADLHPFQRIEPGSPLLHISGGISQSTRLACSRRNAITDDIVIYT